MTEDPPTADELRRQAQQLQATAEVLEHVETTEAVSDVQLIDQERHEDVTLAQFEVAIAFAEVDRERSERSAQQQPDDDQDPGVAAYQRMRDRDRTIDARLRDYLDRELDGNEIRRTASEIASEVNADSGSGIPAGLKRLEEYDVEKGDRTSRGSLWIIRERPEAEPTAEDVVNSIGGPDRNGDGDSEEQVVADGSGVVPMPGAPPEREPVWTPGEVPAGDSGPKSGVQCQNCESFVTRQYARVMTPRGVDRPRCCPNCPDMTRGRHNRARPRRDGVSKEEIERLES